MNTLRFLSYFTSFAINLLILFFFTMVVGGFIYTTRRRLHRRKASVSLPEYPMLSVIVPARNEEYVIRPSVLSLLNQDYPADRFEILVVNDNSSDGTGEVLYRLQEEFPQRALRVLTTDERTGGKGKASVLNMAVKEAKGDLLAIYDADNTPEPDALRHLVCALAEDEQLVAVMGKFRTRNRRDSLLSRLIDQETLLAQAISQAGFWMFFHIGVLPGTNFIIRRSALEEVGGWEGKALTEDTEISFRLLGKGRLIKYIPEAVTWEQEPSRLRAWFRQRNRWARGNLTLMFQNFPNLFRRIHWRLKLVEFFLFSLYFMLFFSSIFSDCIFVSNLFHLTHFPMTGPLSTLYRFSWGTQILLYTVMVMLALWQEPDERSVRSLLLIPVLLFGYARLWYIIIVCAAAKMVSDKLHHREASWDKTVHLAEDAPAKPPLRIRP